MSKNFRHAFVLYFVAMLFLIAISTKAAALTYPVEDTGQVKCYNNTIEIYAPSAGQAFYGQDGQINGNLPNFTKSSDGLTVHDNVTGLTWQQTPDRNGDGAINSSDKIAWANITSYVAGLNTSKYGGFNDWRLPSIKELYSLIDFRGTDPSGYSGTDTFDLIPFIDTAYFAFGWGDTTAGERIIDAQYWSSTQYVSTTMGSAATVFGVNFADGRIKGYPRDIGPGGKAFTEYIRCVRGSSNYGINDFKSNGDGTVTDNATGLMWSQSDSGSRLNWQQALAWVQTKNAVNYLGHNDWRLPNAKELQSIVDYTRSPATTSSAAINAAFSASSITNEAGQSDYPCYWTGTTRLNWTTSPGNAGIYVAFGRAMGYMNSTWMDVHGAGAQRSDPKEGDPADYPYGRGPQGDAIRIFNYVRLVRDAAVITPTPTITTEPTNTPVPTTTPTPALTPTPTPISTPAKSTLMILS